MPYQFEWDAEKAATNLRKHGVSFEEARSVFYDERALLIEDPDEVSGEDRFVLLGMGESVRMLLVCHCYREPEAVIRIISARKAGRAECADYERRWRR